MAALPELKASLALSLGTMIWPFRWKRRVTEPCVAIDPPLFVTTLRISDAVRFRLSVLISARALLDSPLDVIVRHVGPAALEQHHPEPRVHARVTTAQLGGDGDFLAQLRENLPALRIQGAFEVLHFGPLAMTCHIPFW